MDKFKVPVERISQASSVEFILIESEEQLLDTIAYIDRNSIVAGGRYLPSEYPWGSARYMFRERRIPCGRHISEMSKKEVHESLNTWSTLPEDWMVDDQGMLIPERCFINIDFIEGLFRSPTRYLYHLSRKLEGKIEMQQGIRAFIPDKELRPVTEELAKKTFRQIQGQRP